MAELAGGADVAGCVAEVAGGEGAPPLAPASPLQLLVDAVAEPLPEGEGCGACLFVCLFV